MFEEYVPLKPRADGTYIFFPNGIFSQVGFILSQKEAKWVRNFTIIFYSISMSTAIIGIFVLHKYLLTLLILLLTTLIYHFKIKKFTKDKLQAKERLKSFESIQGMSKKIFFLMILAMLGSVFFIVLDLVIIVRMDRKFTLVSTVFLLFSILLFILFFSIVILKLVLRKKGN